MDWKWRSHGCQFCDEQFYCIEDSRRHHDFAHPTLEFKAVLNINLAVEENSIPPQGSQQEVLRCKNCFHSGVLVNFESLDLLKAHIRSTHLSWSPFRCFWCSVSGSGVRELLPHLRIAHPMLPAKVLEELDSAKDERIEKLILRNPRQDLLPDRAELEEDDGFDTSVISLSSDDEHCEMMNSTKPSTDKCSPVKTEEMNTMGLENNQLATDENEGRFKVQSEWSSKTSNPSQKESNILNPNFQPNYSNSNIFNIFGGLSNQTPAHNSTFINHHPLKNQRPPHDSIGEEINVNSPHYCFGCNKMIPRDKRKHTWEHHFPRENIICCPMCKFSTRYSITAVRKHISTHHLDISENSFIDRRVEYEEELNNIFRQCFKNPMVWENSKKAHFRSITVNNSPSSEPFTSPVSKTVESKKDEQSEESQDSDWKETKCSVKESSDRNEPLQKKRRTSDDSASFLSNIFETIQNRSDSEHNSSVNSSLNRTEVVYNDKIVSNNPSLIKEERMETLSSQFSSERTQQASKILPQKRPHPSYVTHKLTHLPLDTNSPHYCFGCHKLILRDKRKHVWERHFPIKAIICCPKCDLSTRYEITSVRKHIAKFHPDISPLSFIDKRVEYEQALNQLFAQCFRDPMVQKQCHHRGSIRKTQTLPKI